MGIQFNASLWKISRDHDDELTVILKVPASDFIKVVALPTKTNLKVDITGDYNAK